MTSISTFTILMLVKVFCYYFNSQKCARVQYSRKRVQTSDSCSSKRLLFDPTKCLYCHKLQFD